MANSKKILKVNPYQVVEGGFCGDKREGYRKTIMFLMRRSYAPQSESTYLIEHNHFY